MANATQQRSRRRNTRQFQMVRYWVRDGEEYDSYGKLDCSHVSGPYVTRTGAQEDVEEERRNGNHQAFISKEICYFDLTNQAQRVAAARFRNWRDLSMVIGQEVTR